ncbi:MAG: DMT family transporter [Cyclobacteriaceae bacterium]
MNRQLSHFLQLGLAIFIMSSSGTLGRFIDMPPPVIIWVRCVIAAVALFVIIKFGPFDFRLPKGKQFYVLFVSSLFLGAHWVSYFYALKLSSVAVGMLSLFTYPVITAFLEPIMLKTRFDKVSIVFGLLALVGVALLAPELSLSNDFTVGILIGVGSALVYSIRNIMMKTQVSGQSGVTLMFYQLLIIDIALLPVVFMFDIDLGAGVLSNWKPYLVLGLLTTAAGHTLFVLSFKNFSITTVSIISAITPLMGTLLGFMVLGEIPSGRTYIGGLLIFLTVIAESVKSVRSRVD